MHWKKLYKGLKFFNCFFGVDDNGKPVKTFEIIPETNEEKRRYIEALQRRQNRLSTRKDNN